jgi:RNA-directed DNA polymerase
MREEAKARGNARDRGSSFAPRRKAADFPRVLTGRPQQRNCTDVKDRVRQDIGATAPLTAWAEIDWKRVRRRVKNLRQRIYRATENGQWKKVRNLTKLMLRSHSNLLLSVRHVTQESPGRKTAGIDGQTVLTPAQRGQLVKEMADHRLWQAQPARRIYIPKAKGKLRPLSIPTVKNRVAQAMVKNALEPSWEARFEANSYGFRPGRSCQDAIEHCHARLRTGKNCPNDRWLLDGDLQSAFDNLNHEFILSRLGAIPGRELVKQWLKAGYVEAEVLNPTPCGAAQGAVISPMLLNIALDGMERLLDQYSKVKEYTIHSRGRTWTSRVKSKKYGFSRYADDLLVTAQTREDIEAIKPILADWLSIRGLTFNEEKTRIVPITYGVNFLGVQIRHFGGRCLTVPQKEKVLSFLREVRAWLKTHRTVKPEAVLSYLNPVLRGWANYYKHSASKRVFSYVDDQVWKALWAWALRRHPNKGKQWVAQRYFLRESTGWTFKAAVRGRSGQPKGITLHKMRSVPIERHVKVKGTASPDDPTLGHYWQDRRTRYGKSYWVRGSKLFRVAVRQDWTCPVCAQHLFNGEDLHTHHTVPLAAGGSDDEGNLVHLHHACHRQLHGRRRSLEPRA